MSKSWSLVLSAALVLIVVIITFAACLTVIEYTRPSVVFIVNEPVTPGECDWYHEGDWWSHWDITKVKEQRDPFAHISDGYDYSIPTVPGDAVNNTEETNTRCKYKGRVFNIGLQKPTALDHALVRV